MSVDCKGVCGPIPDIVNLKVISNKVGGKDQIQVVQDSRLWPNSSTLYYTFLDGTDAQKSLVTSMFNAWVAYANIKPTSAGDNSSKAHVRITFKGTGAWSTIGTDALKTDGPTMCLAYVDPKSPTAEHRAIVLHEIGHALGMTHEWDGTRTQVVADKTSEGQIAQKMDQDYKGKKSSNFGSVTPSSVMSYFLPKSLTKDKKGVPINTQLSASDKAWLVINYSGKVPVLDGVRWSRLRASIQLGITPQYSSEIMKGQNSELIRSQYATWVSSCLGDSLTIQPGLPQALASSIGELAAAQGSVTTHATPGAAGSMPMMMMAADPTQFASFAVASASDIAPVSGSSTGPPSSGVSNAVPTSSSSTTSNDVDQTLNDVFGALVLSPAFQQAVVNMTNADLPNHKVFEKDFPIPPAQTVQSDVQVQQGLLSILGPLLFGINASNSIAVPTSSSSVSSAVPANGVQSTVQSSAALPDAVQQGIFDAIASFTKNPIFTNVVEGIAKGVLSAAAS